MTEFECFKIQLKNMIKEELEGKRQFKKCDFNNLSDVQKSTHNELLKQLNLYANLQKVLVNTNSQLTALYQKQYKQSIKTINEIIIDNLSLRNTSYLHILSNHSDEVDLKTVREIEALPFLAKIKKLNIPLDETINFEKKTNHQVTPDATQIIKRLKRFDLYLQSFSASKELKEKVFSNYIKKQTDQLQKVSMFFSSHQATDELMACFNSYFIEKEKFTLELSIEKTQTSPNKKIKL